MMLVILFSLKTMTPFLSDSIVWALMAHLHYRRRTPVQTLFPVLRRNREYGFESDSVQCEMFCIVQCSHRVWDPNPIPSVSVNENEPLPFKTPIFLCLFSLTDLGPDQIPIPILVPALCSWDWKLNLDLCNGKSSK